MGASISEIGNTYGNLTVISEERLSTRRPHWLCICSCGKSHVVSGVNLRKGRTTRCISCTYVARGMKKRLHVGGGIPKTYWDFAIKGAIERNISFAIEPEEAYEKFVDQKEKCAISGVHIGFRDVTARKQTASLDRIDSSRGYTPDNIQWVHKDINLMKNRFDQTEFINWCRRIVDHADLAIGKGRTDPTT